MIIMESPATSPAIGSTASIITSLPPGTEDVPNDPGCVFICIYDLHIIVVLPEIPFKMLRFMLLFHFQENVHRRIVMANHAR